MTSASAVCSSVARTTATSRAGVAPIYDVEFRQLSFLRGGTARQNATLRAPARPLTHAFAALFEQLNGILAFRTQAPLFKW